MSTTKLARERAEDVPGDYRLRSVQIAQERRGRYPWALLVRCNHPTYGLAGPLIFVLAFIAATAFLTAVMITIFVVWLPVVVLSFVFGAISTALHTSSKAKDIA